MKNPYLTSYFPLFSIVFFSLSFSIYSEGQIIYYLSQIGLYEGMIEFISERGIHLTLLFLLWLTFFMLFAALKLIADTINEVSLLFFSRDIEGSDLRIVRNGAWIFLIAGILSIGAFFNIYFIIAIFASASLIYFVYFVYKVSGSISSLALVGMIFFHMFFWFSFLFAVSFALLKLYNSFIASLPL